jgi:C-terminal processing protease CtpA/Prc
LSVSRLSYLNSASTSFSAAEALAFELQAKRRATIIGEATGGGASPSPGMDLESDYVVIMPIGRMRPVDGRTWEGKGVMPDIATPAGNALTAAQSEVRCLQR